jgi:hypothetical protein
VFPELSDADGFDDSGAFGLVYIFNVSMGKSESLSLDPHKQSMNPDSNTYCWVTVVHFNIPKLEVKILQVKEGETHT